jgi:flagellar hook-associated protein 3 FlgL
LNARNLFEASPDERASGRGNMVHALESFYECLRANDKHGIKSAMDQIEFHMDKTTSYQASIGGMFNSISKTQERAERDTDFSKASLSNIEDADAFKVASDFKKSESMLQSTLLASNKMLQPSLLNFMQ